MNRKENRSIRQKKKKQSDTALSEKLSNLNLLAIQSNETYDVCRLDNTRSLIFMK